MLLRYRQQGMWRIAVWLFGGLPLDLCVGVVTFLVVWFVLGKPRPSDGVLPFAVLSVGGFGLYFWLLRERFLRGIRRCAKTLVEPLGRVVGPRIMAPLKRVHIGVVLNWVIAVGVSIIPFLSLILARAAGHSDEQKTVLFAAVGCVEALLLTVIMRNLVVGVRTDVELGCDGLMLGVAIAATVWAASVAGMQQVFLAATAVATIAFAAVVHVLVSIQKTRLRDYVRQLDIRIKAQGWFFGAVATLIRTGAPAGATWSLLRVGEKANWMQRESQKEIVKGKVILLFRLHRYDDVIRTARAHNQQFTPGDSANYSVTLANYKSLAYLRIGREADALRTIEKATREQPDNPYYLFTFARTLWHTDRREEALETAGRADELYEGIYERRSLAIASHRIYYLEETALDHYFRKGFDEFQSRLDRAKDGLLQIYENVTGASRYTDLIHNCGNLLILEKFRGVIVAERPGTRVRAYQAAARDFAWCVRRNAHFGARLRIALLHAIGTRSYEQALMYLKWLEDALNRGGDGWRTPLQRRVGEVIRVLERATENHFVFDDTILLYQSTAPSVPSLLEARLVGAPAEEEAVAMRRAIFDGLSLARRPHVDMNDLANLAKGQYYNGEGKVLGAGRTGILEQEVDEGPGGYSHPEGAVAVPPSEDEVEVTHHAAEKHSSLYWSLVVASVICTASLGLGVLEAIGVVRATHPLFWLPIGAGSAGVAGSSYIYSRRIREREAHRSERDR